MAGDAKVNKANSGKHQRVELSESAKASEGDVKRLRTLSGQARKAGESIARRKRMNSRALRGR